MSISTLPPKSDPQSELERELRHVRSLVFVRELLRGRGAAPEELRECDAAIAEARAGLAWAARDSSSPLAAA